MRYTIRLLNAAMFLTTVRRLHRMPLPAWGTHHKQGSRKMRMASVPARASRYRNIGVFVSGDPIVPVGKGGTGSP